MLQTFYACMKREYDWRYTKNNFKGQKGCVDGVLTEIYDQRLKQYASQSNSFQFTSKLTILTSLFSKTQGSKGYSQRNPACALMEEESAFIDLSMIKEEKLVIKQIKLMVGFGALLVFCWSDEHTYMMFHKIGSVFFSCRPPIVSQY